ncbi:transglycosylase SLT domain-containing protein [Mesorhizobium sp. 65-26]|nr:transglycosylase SLT domain-containing protein [Mesorhizobium sp. 65-26]MBN9258463.1 transglycosylase SLT domain-containing protein [Mesorhizobium sp.]
MPKLVVLGIIMGAAAISGCTTASQVKPVTSVAETATVAGNDAGFTVPLPETVSVLPEPSGLTPVQTAELPVEPSNAFAGSTPMANSSTPVGAIAAHAQPAVAMLPAPAMPGETGNAKMAGAENAMVVATHPAVMPAVQQAAYIVPQNPAATIQFPVAPDEGPVTGTRAEIDRLIGKYAAVYQVPIDLVRHVVNRESTFNPRAYNNGHWGLMQIKHATARGMGYDGPPKGLFDAETNLKYAVKYLRGAWLVSGGNAKRADQLYQTGYYYDAKRKGLLEATGLGHDRGRRRVQPDA